MDRFDCQYLMATFVNVYIASFIRYSTFLSEPSWRILEFHLLLSLSEKIPNMNEVFSCY